MSWLTRGLSTIGHAFVKVAGVLTSPEATAAESFIPVVGTLIAGINPTLAALLAKGSHIVDGVEALITTAKAGALKHQTAVDIAVNEIPNLEEVLAEFGADVKIPQAELKAALDGTVASKNLWKAFYDALAAANKKPAPPA